MAVMRYRLSSGSLSAVIVAAGMMKNSPKKH
jgi:hypothetical protein